MNYVVEKKLGDLLTFQRGFDITKNEQQEGNVPIVSSSGISSFHNHFKANAPGVVIGRKGSLGTVHYLNTNYWPHDTTLWVKDFKGNEPRFIYYFLQTLHLENFDVGSSNPTLNRNHLHKIRVLFPKEQQKKIAAVLSAYDDLIENNRRRIELLERMAEELHREWFGRLRFPGYQQAKFEKGSPSTWQKKKFGEFCGLKRGYDLPDAQIEDGSFPIIASASIKAFHNQFKVEPPVICTGRSGSLGTVLFVNERAWPLNTALYVQKLHDNSPYLIYFTLKNMGLASFNSGAGVPSLNRNHLNGISISVPDKPLQQAFDNHVSVLFNQKDKLVEACSSLQKSRNALLTRLISGKLPVDQLDIHFPPSMREADAARQEVAHA